MFAADERKPFVQFSLPDQLALLGLAGVTASGLAWVALSWADSVMRGSALTTELFAPLASQEVVRLCAIVLILASTLFIQILFGRRLRVEQLLRGEQARIRQMYERSPDAILTVDDQRRVLYANPQAEVLAAKSASHLVGVACHVGLLDCDEPCKDCPVPNVFATGDIAERTVAVEVGGHHRWLEQVFYPVLDAERRVESVIESTRDTTMARMAQTTMHRMAFYDPLTDLPNRALFLDRLAVALSQAHRRSEIVAVVFVDLDDFKETNDMFGHGVGDGLLKAVGSRLRDLMREEDTVARQGGDEFTIIARVSSRESAGGVAKRILESIGAGFKVDGHQLYVSASIGVATYPNDGERPVDLIRNADAAIYRAKDSGHNVYRLFTPDMSRSTARRLELETALRNAIDHDEFELYYQPQVDVRDGRFVGVEALLRWNHPARGLIAPGEFIELAEQAGFIGEIGYWVLRTACGQARQWLTEGLDFGRVAVNLSAREFVQSNIVENVARTLEDTGLDACMLELEITETVAMYNVEQILAILELLRDMGVRVAIDDFGTGYSSMSYLKRFPVQTLKLAQDFMHDVEVDSQSAAIASMLIRLCRELDLDMVAEGVENVHQLQFLRERGCYVIQGYLFSRPVSSSELGEMLRSNAGAAFEASMRPVRALSAVTCA